MALQVVFDAPALPSSSEVVKRSFQIAFDGETTTYVTNTGTATSAIIFGGPPGTSGASGTGGVFEYLMPVAQTTATFGHTLVSNPTAIQVFVDGALCDEYSVSFPLPGIVQLGFDVSVRAFIRMI